MKHWSDEGKLTFGRLFMAVLIGPFLWMGIIIAVREILARITQ